MGQRGHWEESSPLPRHCLGSPRGRDCHPFGPEQNWRRWDQWSVLHRAVWHRRPKVVCSGTALPQCGGEYSQRINGWVGGWKQWWVEWMAGQINGKLMILFTVGRIYEMMDDFISALAFRHHKLLLLSLQVGISLLLVGIVALNRVRMEIPLEKENQTKLVKFMIRMGVFSVLYLVPLFTVIGCYFYEHTYRTMWEMTWMEENCRRYHIPCPFKVQTMCAHISWWHCMCCHTNTGWCDILRYSLWRICMLSFYS